jgi:flagellar protein FlaF
MAVLFVGVLVAISTAYPVMSTANERVNGAVEDRGDRSMSERNSNIELANTTYNASNDTLVVWVTNSGSRTLSVNDTDVLVNGAYRQGYDATVDGASRTVWVPGETLRIELSASTRPDRVKVITEFGIAVTETEV